MTWGFGGGQLLTEADVAEAGQFDEGAPGGVDEVVLNEEVPGAVGALVEVRHGEIGGDGAPIDGAAAPDRSVGEETAVHPGVALFEFLGRHVLGTENGVGGIVERPFAMQKAAFGFHLAEERRGRVRGKDVECGALEAVLLNPVGGACENVFAVVIES